MQTVKQAVTVPCMHTWRHFLSGSRGPVPLSALIFGLELLAVTSGLLSSFPYLQVCQRPAYLLGAVFPAFLQARSCGVCWTR